MVGFTDNGGSMSRRMIIFRFPNKIGEAMDGTLPWKLEEEMGAILAKCSQAYVAMSRKFGDDNIWKHACSSMKEERKELEKSNNSLQRFLSDPSVSKVSPGIYCRKTDFIQSLREFCQLMSLPKLRWNREFYESIFRENGITIEEGTRVYDGASYTEAWVVGADLMRDGRFPSEDQ